MERYPLWDPPARPFCRPPTSISIHHRPSGTLPGPPLSWHWHAGRWVCFTCPRAMGSSQAVLVLLGLSDKTEDDIQARERPPAISTLCQLNIILSSIFFSCGVMEL